MASDEKNRDYHRVTRLSPGILLADVASGIGVAAICSIPVCLIDTAVMRKVSKQVDSVPRDVARGLKVFATRPHHFFSRKPSSPYYYGRVHFIVSTVYGLTFAASNVVKSFCEVYGYDVSIPLLVTTASVNTLLTIWKDSTFLRMPEIVGSRPRVSVPFFSKCCFATRDTITCFAAFVLVDYLARWVREMNPEISLIGSKDVAQLITPSLLQFVTTPFHIMGITASNTHPGTQLRDLYLGVTGNYGMAVFSRMFRIVPSFGIGALGNRKVRSVTTKWVEKNGY